jgi:hypothetical protein
VTESIGETIAKALESRGSPSTGEAVDVAIDVCEALAEAHAEGLLHGDLTTNAIQVAPIVKVFGIGTTHALLALRKTEELGIRAPEQLDPANPIDARADVWSVGVILYTMLAGAPPFSADSPSTTNVSVALDEPPQLAGVPDALADVVDSCLAKNPVLRPHTVRRLAEELAPFASDPAGQAARIAEWPETVSESEVTLAALVAGRDSAATLSDADSTAPRTALGREAIRREGGLVSDPRSDALLDAQPSVREMMKSEPPPPVARTLPPPREMSALHMPRRARWTLGMHPMTLIGASACIVVASVIAAGVIQRGPTTSDARRPAPVGAAAAVAPPPTAEARLAPTPAIVPAATAEAPIATAIPASALPDSPLPASAPKRYFVRKAEPKAAVAPASAAATAAASAPTPDKPVTHQPAPEPKASDDDLRKFLDDRR